MAQPRTSTRDRILEACRTLFNERGPSEVTTAEIAAEVGISEGNLHYHFRRKEQIVVALFDRFEAAIEQAGIGTDSRHLHPQPHLAYLVGWFNSMWEWRCFYASSIYRLVPALQPRLTAITNRGQAHIRRMLHELIRDGVMVVPQADIDPLVVNAWIVATNWIDYLRYSRGVQNVTREDLRWGFSQVEALIAPYAAVPSPSAMHGGAVPTLKC